MRSTGANVSVMVLQGCKSSPQKSIPFTLRLNLVVFQGQYMYVTESVKPGLICTKYIHLRIHLIIHISFSLWVIVLLNSFGNFVYNIYVTRHEKTGLMCTKYTYSYYSIYLLYCIRFQKSVSCMRFPMKSCINGVKYSRLL